ARAGALYGLTVLHRDAQDAERNATRFAVLTREPVEPPAADKASVVFTLPDEVGALARVMAAFARRRINLKRLQSRPVPEAPWTYRFHADLEWISGRRALLSALEEAGRDAQSLTLLGLYANNRRDAP
ncbi:MAG: ACT domain-containing protein, partial [Christensenellaceae bacterium]|nr:ACT domain-containing protein [Christensenellaceae bacterium]